MKTLKKTLILAIAAALTVSLVACGDKKEDVTTPVVENPAPAPSESVEITEAPEVETTVEAEVETPTEGETEAPVIEETEATEGETEAPGEEIVDVVASNDWKDFVFTLNGKTYQLPMSYKEFKEATGLTIKGTEEKSWLEPNYYSYFTLKNAEDFGVAVVDILNTSEEDAEIANCTIISISQYDSHVERSGMAVEIAGLKIGDITSKEDLIAMFGEPTKLHEYRIKETDDQSLAKYETDTYTWCINPSWTTDNYFKVIVNVHTGIIEELHMDNTPN